MALDAGSMKTFTAPRHQLSHQNHSVNRLIEAPKGPLIAKERAFSAGLRHLGSSRSCTVVGGRCVDLGFWITVQNLILANSGKMEPY